MLERVVSPESYAFNPAAVPVALTAVGIFLLGAVVFVWERASHARVAFVMMCLTMWGWLSAFTVMYCATDPAVARWWAKAAYLAVPLIPATLFQFAVAVLRLEARWGWLIRLSWFLSLFFVLTAVGTDLFIRGVWRYGWGFYPQYGWASGPFLIYFFVILGLTLRLYETQIRRAPAGSTYQRRVRSLRIAFLVAYVASVDYLAKFGIPCYPFGYVAVLIFVGLTVVALRRYRLVDITPSFAARQILEAMADPLLACDADGLIRLVNPAACTLLGSAPETFLGQPLERFVPDRPEDRQRLQTLMAQGTAREAELTLLTCDGQPIPVSVSVARLKGPDRQGVGTVLLAKDLRERKQLEAELIRIAAIPERMPTPIVETNLDGQITYLNASARAMFPGLLTATSHPAREAIHAAMATLRASGRPFVIHAAALGDRFYEYHVSYLPETRRLLSYVVDVTERRQEEAMARTTAELERFNQLLVGREQRIVELKRRINALTEAAGQPPPYDLAFADETQGSEESRG